jgi:hypothetical protein
MPQKSIIHLTKKELSPCLVERRLQTTKRRPQTTKRRLQTTKRMLQTLKVRL